MLHTCVCVYPRVRTRDYVYGVCQSMRLCVRAWPPGPEPWPEPWLDAWLKWKAGGVASASSGPTHGDRLQGVTSPPSSPSLHSLCLQVQGKLESNSDFSFSPRSSLRLLFRLWHGLEPISYDDPGLSGLILTKETEGQQFQDVIAISIDELDNLT